LSTTVDMKDVKSDEKKPVDVMAKPDQLTVTLSAPQSLIPDSIQPAEPPAVELTVLSNRSKQIFEEALKIIPSGASSNMRVHLHEPYPVIFDHGRGSKVWDADGNEYIDYLMAYGALILGHAHPNIIAGITEQIKKGTLFGTTTELEVEVAKLVCSCVPCAEMVSFANTGTEATMEAIRIARAVTGKDKLLKFEGHYHGHHDYVLYSVDSPSAVAGLESAPAKLAYFPGIPDAVSQTVLIAPWNNVSALERTLKKRNNEIAAVICEPVMTNQGVIAPAPDYLKQLRELTTKYDVLLIFDEVVTGFRLAKGGAQELYGVIPDLACYAKALGGGAPIAAVAGKREYMSQIGPGKIGYGGTYNANAISLAAAKATLETLLAHNGDSFKHMAEMGTKLRDGLKEVFNVPGYRAVVNAVGPVLSIAFSSRLKEVVTYRQSLLADQDKFERFRAEMLRRGIYSHPDGAERWTLTMVHTEKDIENTITAARESIKALRSRKET